MITEINDIKRYNAKVILYGEYGVTLDGEVLAVPLPSYFGYWTSQNVKVRRYSNSLLLLKKYLQDQENDIHINVELLDQDIREGYFFESNIPNGYGLGSSGAYTAGFYDRYVLHDSKSEKLETLQMQLAFIESCFHGVSSGIDPLISYTNQAIHKSNDAINQVISNISSKDYQYFLVNTHISRKTSPLVKIYFDRIKNDKKYASAQTEYLDLNKRAIQAHLTSDKENILPLFKSISAWQYSFLDFAIPSSFNQLWSSSQESESFGIKMCGAGGGGFFLGVSIDKDETIRSLGQYDLDWI